MLSLVEPFQFSEAYMKFFARNWHLAWVSYSYLEEKSIIVIKCANFYWDYFWYIFCAVIYF